MIAQFTLALASLAACLSMLGVCALQLREMLRTARGLGLLPVRARLVSCDIPEPHTGFWQHADLYGRG